MTLACYCSEHGSRTLKRVPLASLRRAKGHTAGKSEAFAARLQHGGVLAVV